MVNELAALLQLEIGALLGRTAATTFTATRESALEAPTHEAMPAQAFLAHSDGERERVVLRSGPAFLSFPGGALVARIAGSLRVAGARQGRCA